MADLAQVTDSPLDVLDCNLLQASPDAVRQYVRRLFELANVDLRVEMLRLDLAKADVTLRRLHTQIDSLERQLLAINTSGLPSQVVSARSGQVQVQWSACQQQLRAATTRHRQLWDEYAASVIKVPT
jgi:septation ring formation regulator EzrA